MGTDTDTCTGRGTGKILVQIKKQVPGSTVREHEAEIPGGRDQRVFVGRLSLVVQVQVQVQVHCTLYRFMYRFMYM